MNQFANNLWSGFARAYSGVESWVSGLFAFSGKALPIEQIANQVDPRFLPQAPMSGEQIDIKTRMEMSSHGFKHAKLVTAETHPELHAHWDYLCKRAGFTQPLQLILCESDIPNAFAVSDSEMGFTTGLLQHLTYREVIAVLSHELGHANNFEKQQGVHVATAGGMGLAGLSLPWIGKAADSAIEGDWMETRNRGLAAITASSIGQITGSKIAGYNTELEADLEGAVISRDPEALISALQKLDAEGDKLPAWRKAVGKIFAVHPPTPERVRWLEEAKRELDATAPMHTPFTPAAGTPALQIAAGQTAVERVSTNQPETAISGA